MNQLAKLVLLQLLRVYKSAVSPWFPPSCRYVPTCSEYALEAVERYGVVRGTVMTIGRLLRCHPFAHGGYDPVVSKDRSETYAMKLCLPTDDARSAARDGCLMPDRDLRKA